MIGFFFRVTLRNNFLQILQLLHVTYKCAV